MFAETIITIIKDVVVGIYPGLISSLIYAILVMFVFNYALEKGFWEILSEWVKCFKDDKYFRFKFYCIFYIFLVLSRTMLTRPYHVNPLSNVIGNWGLHTDEGKLNIEPFENFIMFIPLPILAFLACKESFFYRKRVSIWSVLAKTVFLSFTTSVVIEVIQLFLRLGTFQLSDLFFNTMGGLFGGILYCIFFKNQILRKKRKSDTKKRL